MNKKLAVFFDCENISPKYIDDLMNKLASEGEAIIKRAYGDWRDDKLKNWDKLIRDWAISPIYTNYYKKPNDNTPNSKKQEEDKNIGKNVSDFAIVIDVMNTINQKKADTIVIVSSDSDFTTLAVEIKSQSFGIIGCGEKKTPSTFQNACSTFVQLPIKEQVSSKKRAKANSNQSNENEESKYTKEEQKLINILKDAINRNKIDDGSALVSQIGVFLKNKNSTLIASNYGHNSWGGIFRYFEDEFEVSYQDKDKHKMCVKIKS